MNQQTPKLNSNLPETVTAALEAHIEHIGDHDASNVYRLVLDEVEPAMLEVMMRYTHGSQSKAAQCMGINRATLRTKLKRHNLL